MCAGENHTVSWQWIFAQHEQQDGLIGKANVVALGRQEWLGKKTELVCRPASTDSFQFVNYNLTLPELQRQIDFGNQLNVSDSDTHL